MHRYNFTLKNLDDYSDRLFFDSKIIRERVPQYEIIMGNLYTFMYYLYSKYKVLGRDNNLKNVK